MSRGLLYTRPSPSATRRIQPSRCAPILCQCLGPLVSARERKRAIFRHLLRFDQRTDLSFAVIRFEPDVHDRIQLIHTLPFLVSPGGVRLILQAPQHGVNEFYTRPDICAAFSFAILWCITTSLSLQRASTHEYLMSAADVVKYRPH